ncbi:MAG: fumarylacetoacetate hydrolase family protein [Sphingopyxis sp.]|nr:fumarylacetoacetate hydrolase family protein [Sphingopyxis sp.]
MIAATENDSDVRLVPSDDGSLSRSLADIIASGEDLADIAARFSDASAVPASEVEFLLPLENPGKIICVGLNYLDHAEESGATKPPHPEIFLRTAGSMSPHGRTLTAPPQSSQLDYEGELVAVVGRTASRVAAGRGLDHVAAYSVFNDLSVRDYQLRTRQWTIGKNFDGFGSFGPWLVPASTLPPGGAGLNLTTRVNGEVMQATSIDLMLFDVATLVEDLSQTMTLDPGDIIVTGTPGGVAMARNPSPWLKPGDCVEVEIDRIGLLRNWIG